MHLQLGVKLLINVVITNLISQDGKVFYCFTYVSNVRSCRVASNLYKVCWILDKSDMNTWLLSSSFSCCINFELHSQTIYAGTSWVTMLFVRYEYWCARICSRPHEEYSGKLIDRLDKLRLLPRNSNMPKLFLIVLSEFGYILCLNLFLFGIDVVILLTWLSS